MGWSNEAPQYLVQALIDPQDMGDTVLQEIPTLFAILQPSIYQVSLRLYGTCSTVAGVTYQPGFIFTHGTLGDIILSAVNWQSQGEGVAPICTTDFGITTLNGLGVSPAAPGTFSRNSWTEIEGIIEVLTPGTLWGAVASSTLNDNYHLYPGCLMQESPVARAVGA